jgi:hypothetical protein
MRGSAGNSPARRGDDCHEPVVASVDHSLTISSSPNSPATTTRASTAAGAYPYVLPPGSEPTTEEAETYFDTFRAKHLPLFPFTVFPGGTTALQLRRERPFFWLCILAISSSVVHRQLSLGQVIREIVAREIVVEGYRNMDLLLGYFVSLDGEYVTSIEAIGGCSVGDTLIMDLGVTTKCMQRRPSRSIRTSASPSPWTWNFTSPRTEKTHTLGPRRTIPTRRHVRSRQIEPWSTTVWF